MPSTDRGTFKHNVISVPFFAFLNATVRPVKFKNPHLNKFIRLFSKFIIKNMSKAWIRILSLEARLKSVHQGKKLNMQMVSKS